MPYELYAVSMRITTSCWHYDDDYYEELEHPLVVAFILARCLSLWIQIKFPRLTNQTSLITWRG